MTAETIRTWWVGDSEPDDRPNVRDAYQHEWWPADGGWRSAHLHFAEPSKTWWWLSMYRGPLKEVSR